MILILKHVFIEGPGIIGNFLQEKGYNLKIIELERNERLPDTFSEIEAVVIMGGPMNVYEQDKYPFLKQEDIFIKRLIKLEIPVLGICLGAQLIAKACEAKVRKAKYKEIGWYKVKLTKEAQNDFLFKDLGKEIDVLEWHEDQFDVPRKGILLAESPLCPQAFGIGKNIYALQFHFEVTMDMIKEWFKEGAEIIAESYRKIESFKIQANKILSRFSGLIQQNAMISR